MPGPRAVEDPHRDAEALALLAEQVLGRDAAVVEEDLAGRRALDPHLRLDPADLEARRVGLDHERGDAGVAGLGIGLGEDDVEVRDAGVGDEALAAVEHVLVALAPRLGAHRGRVGARARLGQRVGGQPLAARQARQPALLLLVAAGELDPERARAPARRGSGRSSRRPSTAPRSRRAPSARRCRCRRTPPRTAARAGRARASARPCPRGTRPSCRSRPRAGRRARARGRARGRGSRAARGSAGRSARRESSRRRARPDIFPGRITSN